MLALVLVLRGEDAQSVEGRGMSESFEDEVINVNLYVNALREELEREDGSRWASGKAPQVSIWIESESKT